MRRDTPLDLRLPIGGLLAAVGGLLSAYGVATRNDRELYAPSGGMNINLVWGSVMLACGAAFLAAVAWRRYREVRAAGVRQAGARAPDDDTVHDGGGDDSGARRP